MVNLYYPFTQKGYLGSNLKDKWLTKSHLYWKPLCYVFLYAWNTHLTFNALLLMIFCLCYVSCYNMIAKFIVKIMSFMPMFWVLWSQHSMLYIVDQDCDGACHLKNYCFVITYLLEDEQELSLGMLDTSQTYL
jgi:hypothetical protein